jgi:hypothetical protein
VNARTINQNRNSIGGWYEAPAQDANPGFRAPQAFAVATGAIGAGAAMLPTGAAAGASARILQSLPDQDDVTNQRDALKSQPDTTPTLSGTKASNGQMGKSA